MKKADYNRISASYDRGRAISNENIDRWLELIQEYTALSTSSSLLDLGCGTGRFALPIAGHFRCHVTGADFSPEMLARAREKDVSGLVAWDIQDAESLTYGDRSFDIVFLSHLLHHTDSPPKALKECKRVLTSPGVILIRYGAIEQIRDDVEHTFFPETVPIDEVRTPSVALVEKWLAEAGFEKVTSLEVVQRTYSSGTARLKAIRLKSTSVLILIQHKALEVGIRRLEKYAKEKPDDPWLVSDKLTLTVGYKRR